MFKGQSAEYGVRKQTAEKSWYVHETSLPVVAQPLVVLGPQGGMNGGQSSTPMSVSGTFAL